MSTSGEPQDHQLSNQLKEGILTPTDSCLKLSDVKKGTTELMVQNLLK